MSFIFKKICNIFSYDERPQSGLIMLTTGAPRLRVDHSVVALSSIAVILRLPETFLNKHILV